MLIWTNSCGNSKGKSLFLDRDGVVNIDRPDYIKNRHEFEFYPDSLKALRLAAESGIRVILISNQSAINRGLITWRDFWDVHDHMVRRVAEEGGHLDAAFYCPHRPDEKCSCRKPSPDMLMKASKLFKVQLGTTFMIGDRLKDLQAAQRAGCQGVLLDRGCLQEKESQEITSSLPGKRYATLLEAVSDLFG